MQQPKTVVAEKVAATLPTQGIGQSQTSNQNAQCVSGKDAIVSCNNENFQNQVNSGNNALAQQGGSGSWRQLRKPRNRPITSLQPR